MPEWYLRRRSMAEKLYRQNKIARYGVDINLEVYDVPYQSRGMLSSLSDLPLDERDASRTVGIVEDERRRSATYFQYNGDVVYLQYSKFMEDALPSKLVVMNIVDAIKKYPWLRRYWFRACPLNLDKYTAFVGSHERAGAFVWLREGAIIEKPIQACLFMGAKGIIQIPHNILIAEPKSSMHIITGCLAHPRCVDAAHIACTEIYVGRGAEVTWTMIHNWTPDIHVRPRMGAIVENGGTLRLNYILISPVKSIQLYPTVILLGDDARVSFRNLLLGLDNSKVDAGSAIIFNACGTRGEIMTRAIVRDQADVKMRGKLWGRKPEIMGHLECRALLLSSEARASAYPTLLSDVENAELTHEAAIGRIAEEELFYLMSRGLTRDEATSLIARGFLDADIPGLPDTLLAEIKSIITATAEHIL